MRKCYQRGKMIRMNVLNTGNALQFYTEHLSESGIVSFHSEHFTPSGNLLWDIRTPLPSLYCTINLNLFLQSLFNRLVLKRQYQSNSPHSNIPMLFKHSLDLHKFDDGEFCFRHLAIHVTSFTANFIKMFCAFLNSLTLVRYFCYNNKFTRNKIRYKCY